MEDTLERTEVSDLLARIEAHERLSFEEWKTVEDSAPTEQLEYFFAAVVRTDHQR